MQNEQEELSRLLKEKFELEIQEGISKEDIIRLLELRISQLIERTPEEFFQLMYRIDIPEPQLHKVLQHNDAIQVLAEMIYSRQLDKGKSRLKYKDMFNDDQPDSDLKW